MEGAEEGMSNEVDKRIVEMQFKNEEFEKNAAKTLQTLQELKQKLNDNFSTKGPEELNKAIQAVDVSPITKGIEAVQVQFSALQIAGKRVIENITDAAMNAVSKITSKLTGVIQQIKVGGSNRAQNIENAKFMLNGLKVEWDDIKDDINYGVQDTAYGLDAAARVASQLVASSVTLGDNMKTALRGVSGVGAMTNSSYEEIGHIFTTVAGQGKLMSMQLNQLAMRGLNVAADLGRAMNKTEAEIRDMVTKGEIDFQTFANAMDELYGEHAKDANKTFSGALSNTKAALSRLGADIAAKRFETIRQILVKIIPKLKELKAALKPIEESVNNAMEAAGKLVEFLIDRIDVKGMIESITPTIQRVIDKITEFANTAKDYIQKLDESKPGKFIKNLQDTAKAAEKIVNFTQAEFDLAKRIWEVGDLGNGEDRVRIITEIGQSYERVQAAVDTFINSGYNWNSVVVEGSEATEEAADAVEDLNKAVSENAEPTTMYLIVDTLYNLARVIKNVVGSALNILSVVKDAFVETFSAKGAAGVVNTFASILGDISSKLYITKEDVEKFKPLFTFIFTLLKGIAKVTSTLAIGGLKALNAIATLFNKIANSRFVTKALEVIGKCVKVISDNLKIVYNRLKDSGVIQKFVNILKLVAMWIGEKLVDGFIFLANHSGDFFVAIGNGFSKFVEWIEKVIGKLSEGNGLLDTIKDFFVKGVETGGSWIEKIGDKISSLFGSEGDSEESIFKKAYDRAAAFGRGIIEGLNSITWEDLKHAGGIVAKLVTAISLLSLIGSLATMNTAISKFFKGLSNLLKTLTSLTYATALRTAASAVESLGRTLLMIVIAIVGLTLAMQLIPGGEEAIQKSIKIVYEFAVLIGFFEVLMAWVEKTKLLNKGKKISITLNARKLAMAAILTAMATMLYTFFQYIKFIAKGLTDEDYDKQQAFTHSMTIAFTMIIGIFSILLLYVLAIMKMAEKLKGSIVGPQLLESISKVISGFTSSLIKIMLTVALVTYVLSKIDDPKAFGRAVGLMIGIFVGLLTIVGWAALISANMTEAKAKDVDIMTNFFSVISGCMARLLLAMAGLAYVFSKVSAGDIWLAIATLVAIFAALVGGLAIINAIHIRDESEFKTKINAIVKLTSMFSLLMAAIAALGLTIGIMKTMGVTKDELLEVITIVTVCVGLLAAIGALAGVFGASAGIASVGTMLAGFGVALMGVAVSVISFALALKILVDVLPKFCDAFETFHNQILEKRDIVVAGIGDFIGVLAHGLVVGIIQALNALINNLEPIIEALIDTLIVICNVLGSALINRSSELSDAIGTLFEGIVTVVVEALGEAIGGIIMGLANAIKDLREKFSDWLGDPEGYMDDEGGYKDETARAFSERLKSSKTPADRRAAYKRWLKENGYDEEGKRTEEWTNEIVITYSVAYDLESKQNNQSKEDWYQAMYGSKKSSEQAAKEAEKVKENTEKVAESMTEANENVSIVDQLSGAISDKFNGATEKLSDINIGEKIGDVTDMIPQLNEDSFNTDAIDNYKEMLNTEAEETATTTQEYADVVNEKTQILETAITSMAEVISTTLETLGEDAKKYGRGVVDGFVEGMTDMSAMVTLRKGLKLITDTTVETIKGKDGLDERSPSHVMEKIGVLAILGFANGISDSVSSVTSATEEAGTAAILSMRETIRRASFDAVNGIEQPRITPVLDLSNVTDGMDEMNGMFDTTHAYRLAMATSADARLANGRRTTAFYQSASPYDDTNAIGAINSLNEEVSTLKGAIEGMQVMIDGRALVGQIATPIDKAIGKKALAGRRKV